MVFPRGPVRAPRPVRTYAAVFAVGRRVYVAGASDRSTRVTLTDEAERPLASLNEGDEVTIVAWRPGWAGTARYCVRVTDSGREGWLPVGNLRSTQAAISSPPTAPAARPAALRAAASQTFGRRSS